MTLRSGVLSCFVLLFSSGMTFGESTFVAAVRYAQDVADTGQYDTAIRALEEALKRYEGSSNTRTLAIALNELGCLYTDVGRTSEARKSLLRSVDISQRQFGAGCQEAQEALINLAYVCMLQRDFARAQKLLEELLRAQEAIVEPLDATRATLYANLASVHLARGHTADGEQWARKAIQVLTHGSVPNPIKIASARHILALARAAAGDTRGALTQISDTVISLEQAGFSDHPEIVPHLLNLAGLQIQLREWSTAEPTLNRALAIVAARLGATQPWRSDALRMLSRVYRETGRQTDAKRAIKSAESIITAYRGQNSLTGLVSIDDLSRHR